MTGDDAYSSFGLSDRLIVASSLTKVYGLGGLRCGWILAPEELARSLRRLTDYLIVKVPLSANTWPRLFFPILIA